MNPLLNFWMLGQMDYWINSHAQSLISNVLKHRRAVCPKQNNPGIASNITSNTFGPQSSQIHGVHQTNLSIAVGMVLFHQILSLHKKKKKGKKKKKKSILYFMVTLNLKTSDSAHHSTPDAISKIKLSCCKS